MGTSQETSNPIDPAKENRPQMTEPALTNTLNDIVDSLISENLSYSSLNDVSITALTDGLELELSANDKLLTDGETSIKFEESASSDTPSEKATSDNEISNSEGSEYIPSDAEQSDNSFSEENNADEAPKVSVSAINSSCNSAEYSLHGSFNVPGNSGCDEREQLAEKSRGKKGGQKKNFCIYCKTEQSKIARHFANKHSDKIEVQKFINLPKTSNERKKAIAQIRKKGNFIFNVNKEWNGGKLIPVRRPNKDELRRGQNFVACAKCRGFYAKNNIRHHYRQCTNKRGGNIRNVLSLARRTVGRIHPNASLVLRRDVIPIMRDDDISRIVRYDELIILYGNKQCKNLRLAHQHDEIRAHLRRLGRFLAIVRTFDASITDMASVFDPKYYNAVIDAVNVLAGLDAETQLYTTPSNASAIGTALKKLGLILEAECIKKHDELKKKHTKNFLKLLSEDYGCSINKGVTETLTHIKRTKKVNLPKTKDIRTLDTYLDDIITTMYEKLIGNYDFQCWKNLAGAVLIKLQLFNRRRAGELERLSLEEFENRQGINENDELYQGLSERDKVSAKKYVRIAIRGKLNRTVPVLMSTKILEIVQLLLKHRESAKVPSKNPYIFGIPSDNPKRYKHLRACPLIRQFSSECGAHDALSLRGTNLRKHIATRCVSLDLNEKQISRVANFMGHHEKIHREIYRQPVGTVDILDISKVLEKAQGLNTSGDSGNNTTVTTDHNTTDGKDMTVESALGTTNEEYLEDSLMSAQQAEFKTLVGKRMHSSNEQSSSDSGESSHAVTRSVKKSKKDLMDLQSSLNVTPLSKRKIRKIKKEPCLTFDSSPEAMRTSKRKLRKAKRPSRPKSLTSPSHAKSKVKEPTSPKQTKRRSTSPYGKTTRRRWTQDEQRQVFTSFGSHIEADTLPSLQEISKVQRDLNCWQDRTPVMIKTWIHNQLRNKKNGREIFIPKVVDKVVSRHIAFIFEEQIADGKTPTLHQCQEVRKIDKKLQSLSVQQIRQIVSEKVKGM